MQLEFHQLDRPWANLRVRDPLRQRHLLASLAEGGQQTPIVVVETGGHKRIAALEQLGRDTVDAVVWEMNEADALLLSRSMRFSPPGSALEQGWLLSEMERRFHYSLDELARRFDRSASWVSRRLALVDLLPEAVQQHVREGKIGAQVAMKHLVPAARVDANDCLRLATSSSNNVAIHAPPSNSMRLGAKARAPFAAASSPSRSCSSKRNASKRRRQPRQWNKWNAIWKWRSPSCAARASGSTKRYPR